MAKRRLEEEWDKLRALAIPADAPTVQLIEMRRAFFAGAEAFFRIQQRAYDGSTPEPTEADLQVLTDLDNEIRDFAAKLAAGVA